MTRSDIIPALGNGLDAQPIVDHISAQAGVQKAPGPKLTLFLKREFLPPALCTAIIERIDSLRKDGITVLIVEQNARLSLSRSDRGYIMANGKIVHTGDAQHILTDPEIAEYFLGGTSD